MYHYQTFRDADAVEFCESKLDLPSDFDFDSVRRVEIYSASAPVDGGEDFCEVRVIGAEDAVICVQRLFSY